MKIRINNMPKLRLVDLLKRRKMTLRQLLDEFGITTYEGLLIRCTRMGVLPPDEPEFDDVFTVKHVVNNPTEGIVVLEPPNVIGDATGNVIDVDAQAEHDVVDETSVVEQQSGSVSTAMVLVEASDTSKRAAKHKKKDV